MSAAVVIGFMLLACLGLPIAFAMGVAALIALWASGVDFSMVPQRMMHAVNSFPLMSIPFFMLAGELMIKAGIVERLIGLANSVVGRVRGGMAHVTMLAGAGLANESGAAVSDASALSAILVPSLTKIYDRNFAAAIVAAAANLGPIIPPSGAMIVYAFMAGSSVSVGGMFMAGVVPGIVICIGFMLLCSWIAGRRGWSVTGEPFQRVRVLAELRRSMVVLAMPVVVIGGIVGGAFTATEGAAIAVVYSLVIGFFVTRQLELRDLPGIVLRAAITSAVVGALIAFASIITYLMTVDLLPQTLSDFLRATTSDPLVFMAMAAAAHADERITFKVIGQPAATGLIQKNKEKPFFDEFAKRTGLPIDADYKSIDSLGIKDTEQLRVMKAGLFDIVSLRVSQNSRDEPTLLGLDLVGAAPDYETARKVYEAYADTLDQRLQKNFQVKLLGIWPFGPQILFCKKPISRLSDLKGMKVRVYDQNLAKFIGSVGGTPVPLSFSEVHQSLSRSRGVVDCAITGPSSANSSNWPEVTTHQYPLGFQMALNGYAITLKAWNRLNAEQKLKMQSAFKTLTDDIWVYSKELAQDALNCNAGKDPCTTGKKFSLVNVPVQPEDVATLRKAVAAVSLPTWAEICDKANPGCSDAWKKTAGKAVGIQ